MTDHDLEQILIEWARYVRNGRARGTHCASAEHKYRSPQTWHPPQPRAPIIDIFRAQRTERAITELPRRARMLLIAHYVAQAAPKRTCMRLRINYLDYGPYIASARLMVAERLTRAFNLDYSS